LAVDAGNFRVAAEAFENRGALSPLTVLVEGLFGAG